MSARLTRSGDAPAGTSSFAPGRGGGRGGGRHAQGAGRGGGRGSGSAGFAPASAPVVPNELTKVDFLKLAKDFTSFSGENDQQPQDYLVQFSKMAKFTNFTSQQLMEVIPLKFTSVADTWLTELQSTEVWEELIATDDPFEAFKVLFTKRFSFGDRNQLARDRLRSLEWRGNAVKLAALIKKTAANTNITDPEQCDRFIQLLPSAMAKHVLVTRTSFRHHTFTDAINMAADYASVERKEKSFSKARNGGSNSTAGGQRQPNYSKKKPYTQDGHAKTAPGSKGGILKHNPVGPRCWGCGQNGHLKRNCPQKHVSFNVTEVNEDEQSK